MPSVTVTLRVDSRAFAEATLWEKGACGNALREAPHSGYRGSRRHSPVCQLLLCFRICIQVYGTAAVTQQLRAGWIPSIHNEKHMTALNPDPGRHNTSALCGCVHSHAHTTYYTPTHMSLKTHPKLTILISCNLQGTPKYQ